MFFAALGVTAGAHRLWAHRTYKAKLPLRIFLAFCQTLAGQVIYFIFLFYFIFILGFIFRLFKIFFVLQAPKI